MPVARSGLDAVPANGFRIQRSKNFSYGGGSIAQDRPVHLLHMEQRTMNIIADTHCHTLASTHAYSTLSEMVHAAAVKGCTPLRSRITA